MSRQPHLKRRESRRDIRLELRAFLLPGEPFPSALWVRAWELWPALVSYLRISRAFREGGVSAALKRVPPVSTHRPERAVESSTAAFYARDAAWRVVGMARTVIGPHLCLEEALGVTAALRRVGFPVQVVIGYPLIEPADGREELHAWPALGALPLTGTSSLSTGSYVELFRSSTEEGPFNPPSSADA